MTRKRTWWTIVLPSGDFDIESTGDQHKLVLFKSKKEAEEDCVYQPDGRGRMPVIRRVSLELLDD